jgi:hypothetical protein
LRLKKRQSSKWKNWKSNREIKKIRTERGEIRRHTRRIKAFSLNKLKLLYLPILLHLKQQLLPQLRTQLQQRLSLPQQCSLLALNQVPLHHLHKT